MLPVGSVAPDFDLPDADGNRVRLSGFRGRPVVLYFYPKDETPGCVAEACAFRDEHAEFERLDAVVIGVSRDTPERHRTFRENRRLPFLLLSDPHGEALEQYEAKGFLGYPKRLTYVIDPEGKIALAHESRLKPTSHVEKALETLRRTAAP